MTIENGQAALLEAMANADPDIVNIHIHHGRFALDVVVNQRQTEIVAVLLKLRANGD